MSQFRPPSQPGWGQPEPGQQPFPQWEPPQQPSFPQPQQQWQQSPMMPVQLMPPPPQKSNKRLWVALIVAVTVVVCSLAFITQLPTSAAHLSAADQQATATMNGIQTDAAVAAAQETAAAGSAVLTQVADNQTASASQPTTAPSPTPTTPHSDVGFNQSTSVFSVTLNSVKTATAGPWAQPASGDIFIVCDVTAQNLSSSPQILSSGASFEFQDDTGQAYDEKITGIGKPPDDTALQPGAKLRGQIVYEVSKNLHAFTLVFKDLIDTDALTWAFSI